MKYTIYQPKKELPDNTDPSFFSLDYNLERDIRPNIDLYDEVYSGNVENVLSIPVTLEGLFEKFNINHPKDFHGHSLSVGDVISLDDNFYYVDQFGFRSLPDFLTKDRDLTEKTLFNVTLIPDTNSKWKIPENAFVGRTDLPEILILPTYISEIGDHAFDKSSVKHIEIPAGCKYNPLSLYPEDRSITGHICIPNTSAYQKQVIAHSEIEHSKNSATMYR